MHRDSFERFYLEKIALGEGCGCAEHVARLRELDRLARPARATRRLPIPGGWLVSASVTLIHRLLKAARYRNEYRFTPPQSSSRR